MKLPSTSTMELPLHVSATLPREKFLAHTVFHYSIFTGFSSRILFHQNPLEFSSQLSCRGRNHRFEIFAGKHAQFGIGEQEFCGNEETQEPQTSSYFEDDLSFLSLNEKPDRNMVLLDDYEAEELDYGSDPNHRSGLFRLFPVKLFICLFSQLFNLLWVQSQHCKQASYVLLGMGHLFNFNC